MTRCPNATLPSSTTLNRPEVMSVAACCGGLLSARSAIQKLYFPGWPCVDLSATPGTVRKTFRSVSRTARPMVALARFSGPKRFPSAFMPMSSTMGPLKMSTCPEPPVLAELAWKMNASWSIASNAAGYETDSHDGTLSPADPGCNPPLRRPKRDELTQAREAHDHTHPPSTPRALARPADATVLTCARASSSGSGSYYRRKATPLFTPLNEREGKRWKSGTLKAMTTRS